MRYVPPRSYFGFSRASPSPTPPTARPRRALPSCSSCRRTQLTPVVASLNLRSAAPPRGVSPRVRASRVAFVPRAAASAPCALTECELDTRVVRAATVNGKTVDASALRAVSVMSPAGDLVNLGEAMGPGKAILVMLRHLG